MGIDCILILWQLKREHKGAISYLPTLSTDISIWGKMILSEKQKAILKIQKNNVSFSFTEFRFQNYLAFCCCLCYNKQIKKINMLIYKTGYVLYIGFLSNKKQHDFEKKFLSNDFIFFFFQQLFQQLLSICYKPHLVLNSIPLLSHLIFLQRIVTKLYFIDKETGLDQAIFPTSHSNQDKQAEFKPKTTTSRLEDAFNQMSLLWIL